MRWIAARVALLLVLLSPALLYAQSRMLSAADSALVGRILLAEDRRNATDAALSEGSRHTDVRVRTLARRALGRIRDSLYTDRDSLPALAPPTAWPEPGWRLRYRALTVHRDDCGALRLGLADMLWSIRLRAADLATASCASDDSLVGTLRGWIDAIPDDASRRERGGVSWHPAAHALVALARLRPDEARGLVARLATHKQWQVRMYAARAAALLADTSRLRVLAREPNDNVNEVAIEALAKLTGHADDDLFIAALRARGAQVARAAAVALKGTTRTDAREVANYSFEYWTFNKVASARDVRLALLELAGRPASDDQPPLERDSLTKRAVALALGAETQLRVTMSRASGGGSFVVRLRGDVAPIMASRILSLARQGYYNGLTWQRVEPDFVIQGGSPGANEYVGYWRYLRDELGTVPHVRGTVGMSTRGHDTGDAQWFVNLKDNLRLNRDYTIFGEVVEGIDVVDDIQEGDVIATLDEVRAPIAVASRACPDLSGNYVVQGEDGRTYANIKQTGCTRIAMEWANRQYDGTSRSTRTLMLDGKFRSISKELVAVASDSVSASFESGILEVREMRGLASANRVDRQTFALMANGDLCIKYVDGRSGRSDATVAARVDDNGEVEAAQRSEKLQQSSAECR